MMLWFRFQAASTDRKGSQPTTFMPRRTAMLATRPPIAPRPMTPRVLPWSSQPANLDLFFSTVLAASASSFRVPTHSIPATMSREASRSAQTASSLTPLALAPGVLKTTMPSLVHLSRGMLLTPAPARAMAKSSGLKSMSSILAERTMMPSGAVTSVPML